MFQVIYDFYTRIFTVNTNPLYKMFYQSTFDMFGQSFTFGGYLCSLLSIITIIFIVVLCWVFVFKIIKLIGGLIR